MNILKSLVNDIENLLRDAYDYNHKLDLMRIYGQVKLALAVIDQPPATRKRYRLDVAAGPDGYVPVIYHLDGQYIEGHISAIKFIREADSIPLKDAKQQMDNLPHVQAKRAF